MSGRAFLAVLASMFLAGVLVGAALTYYDVPLPDEGEILSRVWLDPLRSSAERLERLADGKGWE